LGPLGYLPTDPSQLKDVLAQNGLQLTAGTLFRPFSVADQHDAILQYTHDCCGLLAAAGGQYIVVIDVLNDERVTTAGQSERARRLDATDWEALIGTIREASKIASGEYGIVPVLHSHAGSFIEFEDELRHALDDLSPELVKLCIDTGHLAYAGMDPCEWIRDQKDRLEFLHFKDVDQRQLGRVRTEPLDFFTAMADGVFCPLGQGMVDFAGIRQALQDIEYQGWAVIEQDCDPRVGPNPRRDASSSLEFVREAGLITQ
jgi:inosose dehydratase